MTVDIRDAIAELSGAPLREFYEAVEAIAHKFDRNPLDYFIPYGPQLDFFRLGTEKRERLFMAGNQTGKSTSGAFEAACHLTGNYPEWWAGKRFNHPVTGWACGQSGQQIRETIQVKLFGMPDGPSITGGLITRDQFLGRTLSHGTGDLFDQVRVRHISGGTSTLSLKSYEQDSQKWQGQTVDFIWIDEEAPAAHYSEALARLTGKGCVFTTFTPLLGFSEVISRFLRDDSEDALRDRAVVRMGLKHVEHFTEEEKRRRVAGYPQHERQARENGDPVLGTGAIFATPETQLSINSDLQVPLHWAKLWGIDFGVTHPFAAVLIAWDKDTDIIYVLDTVRLENARPMEHASAMKRIAPDVRVAFPFDGNRRESDLTTLVTNYRREGLAMLPTHATFADGSISTEAGILEMQERMADGRFRIRASQVDWFDEFRGYHRLKDGKINKIRDDLLSATRVAVMAKRFARHGPIGQGVGYGPTKQHHHTPTVAHGVDYQLWG